MIRFGMLPFFAITFSLSTVSLFPTTSDSTRGLYFSTHGSSPSGTAAGGEEEEAVVVGLVVLGGVDVGCLAGD